MSTTQLVLWITLGFSAVLSLTASLVVRGPRRRRDRADAGHAGDAGASGGWFTGSSEACSDADGGGGGDCGGGD